MQQSVVQFVGNQIIWQDADPIPPENQRLDHSQIGSGDPGRERASFSKGRKPEPADDGQIRCIGDPIEALEPLPHVFAGRGFVQRPIPHQLERFRCQPCEEKAGGGYLLGCYEQVDVAVFQRLDQRPGLAKRKGEQVRMCRQPGDQAFMDPFGGASDPQQGEGVGVAEMAAHLFQSVDGFGDLSVKYAAPFRWHHLARRPEK